MIKLDMTKEFNEMIDNDHDIILIRHNTTTHCQCWRKETATPDPDCPNCFGGGFVFKEYIKKCKIHKGSPDELIIYLKVDNDTYYINKNDLVFELYADNNIKLDTNHFPITKGILKKSRWIVYDAGAPKTKNNTPNFKKIKVRIQPSMK